MAHCTRCKSTEKYDLTYKIYSKDRFKCNICGVGKSSVNDGVLHCKSCDYDICASCAEKAVNDSSEFVFMNLRDAMACCTRCRSTEKYLYTHTIYSNNRFKCNICGVGKSSVDDGVLHCNGCKYDICLSCARKKLVVRREESNETIFRRLRDIMRECSRCRSTEKYLYTHTIYSNNRFKCNGCDISKSSVEDGVLHCRECDYNICISCARATLQKLETI